MRVFAAAVLLLLLASPAAVSAQQKPAPSNNLIVPGYAVGDITLGMTQTMVLNRLGMPEEITNDDGRDGTVNVFWIYPQEERRVLVISWTKKDGQMNGGVDFAFTDSKRFVTSKGIVVGDTKFVAVLEKYGAPDRLNGSGQGVTFTYERDGIRFRFTQEGVVSAVMVIPKKP